MYITVYSLSRPVVGIKGSRGIGPGPLIDNEGQKQFPRLNQQPKQRPVQRWDLGVGCCPGNRNNLHGQEMVVEMMGPAGGGVTPGVVYYPLERRRYVTI